MQPPRVTLRGYLAAVSSVAGLIAQPCTLRCVAHNFGSCTLVFGRTDPIADAGLAIAIVGLSVWIGLAMYRILNR